MRISQRHTFHILLLSAAVAGLFGTGCKKENGIVNNNVVRTPYGLLIGQVNGKIENTNDGATYKTIFSIDNSAPRAILTSGLNILMVKYNPVLAHPGADLFVMQTDTPALNFNYLGKIHIKTAAPWASAILDVPSHDAIYAATAENGGVSASYGTHGVNWEPVQGVNGSNPDPGKSSSFTQTRDGNVYGLDNSSPTIFKLTTVKTAWTQTTATGLPAGNFYLSHINNTLLAGDYTGSAGVYYSADGGQNWTQYSGLSSGQQVFSLAAPFDQVVLAGTDSAGIYRLVNGAFVPSNNGLEAFTSVYGIVGKQNIFKNDVIKQYIYIATNKGLFRSEDLGQNWVKVRGESFRTLY